MVLVWSAFPRALHHTRLCWTAPARRATSGDRPFSVGYGCHRFGMAIGCDPRRRSPVPHPRPGLPVACAPLSLSVFARQAVTPAPAAPLSLVSRRLALPERPPPRVAPLPGHAVLHFRLSQGRQGRSPCPSGAGTVAWRRVRPARSVSPAFWSALPRLLPLYPFVSPAGGVHSPPPPHGCTRGANLMTG